MASRSLTRGLQCWTCRHEASQLFTALSGSTVLPLQAPFCPISSIPRRRFSFTPPRLNESSSSQTGDPLIENDLLRDMQPPRPTHGSIAQDFRPWYLQEASEHPAHPLGDRQRIPDLPPNPPPMLHGLLQHISVDIGLDNLTLLDLRHVDPPPALGANLLMIIGTGRSIKHVNVSADRLCRWLRSTHKLRPFADGLLGRNELKLKLRRKARRAKLLNSVGSPMANNPEDGMATGWICVNVGEVDSGIAATEEPQSEDYVGFGRRIVGPKIVIQILTEDKRAELDLEGLWGTVSNSEGHPDEIEITHDRPAASDVRATPIVSPLGTANVNSLLSRSDLQKGRKLHQRSYHASAEDKQRKVNEETLEYEGLDDSSLEPQLSVEDKTDALVRNESPGRQSQTDWDGSGIQIRSLLKHLESLSRSAAVEQLGTGHLDHNSTPFLRKFYDLLDHLPSTERQDRLLNLHSLGVRFNHTGYPKGVLLESVKAMQSADVQIPEITSYNVVRALLSNSGLKDEDSAASQAYPVPAENINDAIVVIHDMISRNLMSLMGDIFYFLHVAVSSHCNVSDAAQIENGLDRLDGPIRIFNKVTMGTIHEAHSRLYSWMDSLGIDWNSDITYLGMLQIHAECRQWRIFWRLWSRISLFLHPRSTEMYKVMFNAVAQSGDPNQCIFALDTYIPMMDAEEPSVILEGEVAEAVLDCLLVIEPGLEQNGFVGEDHMVKWMRLWDRASHGFQNRSLGLGSRRRKP